MPITPSFLSAFASQIVIIIIVIVIIWSDCEWMSERVCVVDRIRTNGAQPPLAYVHIERKQKSNGED